MLHKLDKMPQESDKLLRIWELICHLVGYNITVDSRSLKRRTQVHKISLLEETTVPEKLSMIQIHKRNSI